MRNHGIRAATILVTTCALAFWGPFAQAEFRAGAAASVTTPPLGVSLAGNMNDNIAQQIHDNLHARCLVLDDGTAKLAIVLVDLCMIPRDVCDNAKKLASEATGIPVENMLVAATHTHTGACATPVFQSNPDPAYTQFLEVRIADGIRCAANNLAPAEIAWGAGSVPDEVFCRRWLMKPGTVGPDPFGGTTDTVKMNPGVGNPDLVEPAGPTDPGVSIIALRTLDGRPIALLANYSLHYVGGTGGGHVSADYFACFADRIQALLGADRLDPPFVGIMSNGTSGNINNIDFRNERPARGPYEQMRHVANKVASEVYRVYQTLEFRSDVTLAAAQREIEAGVRKPSPEELEKAKALLAQTGDTNLQGLANIYARETALIAEYPDTIKFIVQAFRIGEVGIATAPCEVFSETGLALKEQSPLKPMFTIELANGYNGYLPTREQHALGGYETWRARSSYLAVDAEEKIRATALDLLGQVAATKVAAEVKQ
ncbi:MAG: hypothetical protein WC655_17685 [Candidatus Hydrogenedentales bacterium]|jgi:hypothetical protein